MKLFDKNLIWLLCLFILIFGSVFILKGSFDFDRSRTPRRTSRVTTSPKISTTPSVGEVFCTRDVPYQASPELT